MSTRLDGKAVIVTGSGSGIGEQAALQFAARGAGVVVADVNEPNGEKVAQAITDDGGEAVFVCTDVSNPGEVEGLVRTCIERFGRLDCAFNNAGISGPMGSVVDYAEDDWERVIGVNLKGVWLCMKYEIPEMLRSGGGAIVNTSSAGGLVGVPFTPAYAAAKAGVANLTRVAALENARTGVRVNAVAPGMTQTPFLHGAGELTPEMAGAFELMLQHDQPVGRWGQPEEIAAAAVWLCTAEASFVTGHVLSVDGGWLAR